MIRSTSTRYGSRLTQIPPKEPLKARLSGRLLWQLPRRIAPLTLILAIILTRGALAVRLWDRIPAVEASGPDDDSTTVYLPVVSLNAAAKAAGPIDGSSTACDTFNVDFDDALKVVFPPLILADLIPEIPEPGWVWVDPDRKFRSVTGAITFSKVNFEDFPMLHDSHDQTADILVDEGQEDILSDVNGDNPNDPRSPDTLHVEWETGTFPSETGKNAPERTFPKWAWPSVGDRVWVDGHWIFDCGHPEDVNGTNHYETEIHPMRAIASMRDQARVLPGTGTTPVPVTATDLYIHGRAGFVVEDLICGTHVILGAGSCSPIDHPHRGSPIDVDFEFAIHLPPRPSSTAVLAIFVEDGPGNSIEIAPVLEPTPADNPTSISVIIPLSGTGVTPDDVYARQIYAGWVFPPDPPLRHLKLTLNKMDLHNDKDPDLDPDPFDLDLLGDCECTFFWMNVDRSPTNEWIRLVDFATGNMNDYDEDGGLGDGEMDFSGAVFDFYVADGQPFAVRANGYDQDCIDGTFGRHALLDLVTVAKVIECYTTGVFEITDPGGFGSSDPFPDLAATFGPPDYGVGSQDVTADGEYELEFTIEEIPLTAEEDAADLRLTKICKPDDIALAGQPITCTIFVDNLGPGLPRNVVMRDTLLTDVAPANYTMSAPAFTFADGLAGTSVPCDVTPPNQFTCDLGTVPIGGRAVISVTIASNEGGDFNNEARVVTDSTDPNLGNNQAIDGLTVVPVSDLALSKTGAPDPVVAGEPLIYTLRVTNDGPSTAVNVLVEDVLPADVSLNSVSATGGASCNAGVPGNPLLPTTCAFDSLAPTTSQTMTIVVAVLPNATGSIHNDARVSSDTLDTNNANNVATTATQISAVADIALTKTASPASVIPGESLTYRLAVANNGPSLARDVTVTDTLPATVHLTGITLAGGGVCALLAAPPNVVLCRLGDLAPGASTTIFIDVQVDPSAPDSSALVNSAIANSSAADPNPANNTDTTNTSVLATTDLSITKTSDSDIYKPSSTVQYIITVTNRGSSDAQEVVVTDNLPDFRQAEYVFDTADCSKSDLTLTCTLGTIPASGSRSFDVYVRIKGSQGEVVNTVSVTSATPDLNSANNTSTWTVLIRGGL